MQGVLCLSQFCRVRKSMRLRRPEKRTGQDIRTNAESRFRMRDNRNHGMGATGCERSGFKDHPGPCFAGAKVIEPCKGADLESLRRGIAFDVRVMAQCDVWKRLFRKPKLFENPRRRASTEDLQLARSDFRWNRSMHTPKGSERSFYELAATANGPARRHFAAVVNRGGFSEIRHDGE